MASDNVIPFPSQGITLGGAVDEVGVSLSLYGDERGRALDPDEITAILGVAPTMACRRGERWRRCRPHPTGIWSLAVEPRGGADAADVALTTLLDQLPSDPAIWAGFRAQYRMRLFFFVAFKDFNRGFGLSALNIARAALIGAPMDFDLYAEDRYPPELDRILNP